jgi:hypothetical protein
MVEPHNRVTIAGSGRITVYTNITEFWITSGWATTRPEHEQTAYGRAETPITAVESIPHLRGAAVTYEERQSRSWRLFSKIMRVWGFILECFGWI